MLISNSTGRGILTEHGESMCWTPPRHNEEGKHHNIIRITVRKANITTITSLHNKESSFLAWSLWAGCCDAHLNKYLSDDVDVLNVGQRAVCPHVKLMLIYYPLGFICGGGAAVSF